MISPHFDDAVLSAGQFLGSWPGAHVLTVCAATPRDSSMLTSFDFNCGFMSAEEAVIARRLEDTMALTCLGAHPVYGPCVDSQYNDERPDLGDVAEIIHATVEEVEATILVGPLGLLHPDHYLVAEAFRMVAARFEIPAYVYEDLPARVMAPEDAVDARRKHHPNATLEFIGTTDLYRKRNAMACYKSQLWALNDTMIYAPERFWRINQCDS